MKNHCTVFFAAIALLATDLHARTLELSGTFENSVTVDPRFPPGATYTLTIDYDESAEDNNASIENADSFFHTPALTYTLSVPATNYTRRSESLTGNLTIARAPKFGKDAAKFVIIDFLGEDPLTIDLEWTVDSPAKAALFASRDLAAADLTPAASDFIWVQFRSFPNVFAFSSLHSRAPTGTPARFREAGFDEIFAFGDSLSGVVGAIDNPLYFEDGYTNGANWVQHLSRALRIPFRRENVVARFGGIASYDPSTFAGTPTERSLVTWWDNSENFRAFLNAFFFGDAVTFEATVLESEERLQRALLTMINQADALGIGNALLLAPVDFGFAPGARRSFDTPEKRQRLSDLIAAINTGLRTRVEATARLYPSVAQRLLDPADYLLDVLGNPSGFGLTEVDTAVISPGEPGFPPVIIEDPSFDGPGADHFFWSGSAPTSCVHRILSEYVIRDVFPGLRQGPQIEVLTARDDLVRVQATRLDSGVFYRLQRSSDLETWSDTDFASFGPARKFTFPRGGRAKEFFRILPVTSG